jgi:hypothetical protein
MSKAVIEATITELNRLQGFKSACYRDDAGKLRYNAGAFQLDYMQPGDYKRCYQLERISGPDGGATCPLGNGRMTGVELLAGLQGLLYAARWVFSASHERAIEVLCAWRDDADARQLRTPDGPAATRLKNQSANYNEVIMQLRS